MDFVLFSLQTNTAKPIYVAHLDVVIWFLRVPKNQRNFTKNIWIDKMGVFDFRPFEHRELDVFGWEEGWTTTSVGMRKSACKQRAESRLPYHTTFSSTLIKRWVC